MIKINKISKTILSIGIIVIIAFATFLIINKSNKPTITNIIVEMYIKDN